MQFVDWAKDAIAYQIFPDRYLNFPPKPEMPWGKAPDSDIQGGTLDGITRKLGHINSLGCNLVYLTPVCSSHSNHRYDAIDYNVVDSVLGGPASFARLVDRVHQEDMRIMLDLAFNHTSDEHPMFQSALKGDQEAMKWYQMEFGDRYGENWVRREGKSYRGWWGYSHMPLLNIFHVPVRVHLIESVKHWASIGADAFRFDVADNIPDPYFWGDISRTAGDHLLIAELWQEKREWLKENGVHGQMNYPLLAYMLHFFGRDAVKADELYGSGIGDEYNKDFAWKHEDTKIFRQSLERLFAVNAAEDSLERHIADANLNLLGSHDTARIATYLPDRSIRAQMQAFIMLSPGIPCVYYGDEIGMEGHKDPDCRRVFNWDRNTWDNEYLSLVRRLIALRHNMPALRGGDFQIPYADEELLAIRRTDGNNVVFAMFNRGSGNQDFEYLQPDNLRERVTGRRVLKPKTGLTIPAHGFRIFSS